MGVSHACGFSDTAFDPNTDVHALEEYQYAIAGLLKQEKFAELDCVANSVRSSKARFSGGAWKLHILYFGLDKPQPGHATEQDWRNHLQRLNAWGAARPNSITARVALAESYVSYAWDARGTGYSDTISDSGVKLFHQRLEKAKVILDGTSAIHNKCPEWYVAMQQVAQGLSWDLPRTTALFEKAASFEPGYYYYYRAHATILLPKWQGRRWRRRAIRRAGHRSYRRESRRHPLLRDWRGDRLCLQRARIRALFVASLAAGLRGGRTAIRSVLARRKFLRSHGFQVQ
jgi:hypothetical protein